jgi:radical SAM protein with 4Fe4S-binding SPASM domain
VDRERTPCPAIYSTMAIHANGNCSICCLDGFGETDMGNVFDEGVAAVWTGEKFTAARRAHETGDWDAVPYCRGCDRWASYSYEDVVKDGVLIRRSPEYTYYNRVDRLTNISAGLLQTDEDAQRVVGKLTGAAE